MHKNVFFILLLLLAYGGNVCFAQSKQLSVYKKNGQIGKRFYEGDRIHLKVGPHGWISGDLEWLLNDTLIVAGFKIGLNQIQAVRTYKAAALGASANLGIAGVLWPTIVAINGATSGSRPLVTNSAIISSAAMLTGAALFYRIGLRTYKTTDAGKLRITDFNFNITTPNVHVPATAPTPPSE